MGILSGLSNLGLGNLENLDIYSANDENKGVNKDMDFDLNGQNGADIPDETDFIYDKAYTCPVCGEKFTNKTARSGKARLLRQDRDLRPVYSNFDPIKYDVISCPECGYSSLEKWFSNLAKPQIEAVKSNISANYKQIKRGDVVSYDEAIERFKLALASCIVKRGHNSEKGYTCLKYAWVLRGKREQLEAIGELQSIIDELKENETELLHNALEGLLLARSSERAPIAGMDIVTLDYLLSILLIDEGRYDEASRLVMNILQSPTASNRIKDKARDLKGEILDARKKSN